MSSDNPGWSWKIPRPPGSLKVGLLLTNSSKAYGNKEIIYANKDKHITYRELNKRTNRLANYFLSKYGSGSLIASLTGTDIESIELYFASAKSGLILMPLSYRMSPKEVENLLNFSKAKALIYEDRFEHIIKKLNVKVDLYRIGNGEISEAIDYESIALSGDDREPNVDIKDSTPLTLGFTSGTTGRPKAFLRTHYENLINHLQYAINFDLTYRDVTLTAIPPLTGISWVCGSLLAGATTIVADFNPTLMLEAIERYRVTIMYGVPTMYYMMLNDPNFDKYNLRSLRAIASVGSVCP